MTTQRRARGSSARRDSRARRRRVQILCVASLWICGAATARDLELPERVPVAPEEIVFSPPGGRFRVVLPAQPVVSGSTRRTLLGTIVEVRYAADIGDTRVARELYDLPHLAAILLPDSAILDRASDGLVEGAGGRVIAAREASHQSFPAREVSYELSDRSARIERALLVLVEHRLYIALATWPSASIAPPTAERLFETFEVWPP
jgi:hypothetical protein